MLHLSCKSSTREVRGRIVRWHANERPVLRRYTLSLSSHIFLVLLFRVRLALWQPMV